MSSVGKIIWYLHLSVSPFSSMLNTSISMQYADQAVTVKACAGLNGMKLGGQLLTVTQATPDASSVVHLHSLP